MSEQWTPKVGDKVMVGEHGPYLVTALSGEDTDYVQIEIPTEAPRKFRSMLPAWLTPAPEPEPDEPTSLGALVRDGEGDLIALGDDLTDTPAWVVLTGDLCGELVNWSQIPRPITVILADPAEVEKLRAERDELRRRNDRALALVGDPDYWSTYSQTRPMMRDILRGES